MNTLETKANEKANEASPAMQWEPQLQLIESGLREVERSWETQIPTQLAQSMSYSLSSGGKRFRPLLAVLLTEAFAVHPKKVLPWACAVELIHTYSLIHDDLPCMDNDDFRRGKATNHKAFSESTALLAGDALLTEAFLILANAYSDEAKLSTQLVRMLAKASGASGMVGGQVLDLASIAETPNLEVQLQIHRMKTGALIAVALEGAAAVCGLPSEKTNLVLRFGEALGLAFQIADDIEDAKTEAEKIGLIKLVGSVQAEKMLREASTQALRTLQSLELESSSLAKMVNWNQNRVLA